MSDSMFTKENEAFAGFLFYGSLLLLKVIMMSPMTSLPRIWTSSMATKEDKIFCILKSPKNKRSCTEPNEAVERVRRAHRNDMENCFVYVFVALAYLATNPDPITAVLHFKIFFYARLLHTVVYLIGLQPARGVCWMVGMGATISMLYRTLSAL